MAVAYRHSTLTTWASRTNTTLTAPTGIQNGDILVIWFCIGQANSAATATPPANFNVATGFPHNVSDAGSYYVNCYVWWKVANNESGNYTVTHSANSSQGWIGAYSGGDTSAPLTPSPTYNGVSWAGAGSGSTVTATGLTTSADGSVVIFAEHSWGDNSNDLTAPSGTTPTFSERTAGAIVIEYVADGVLATAGPTGNKTFTTNNNATQSPWQVSLIAIQPSAGATPKSLADSGAASDAAPVAAAVPAADTGVGADAPTVTVAVLVGAAATASDNLSVSVPISLADAGSAIDSSTVAAAVSLGDVGTSSQSLAVTAAVPATDAGVGATTLAVSATVPSADAGVGADTLTASTATTLSDAGTGADTIVVAAAVPLAGTAGAADSLTVVAAVPVVDAGAEADTLAVSSPVPVADAGSATDTLAVSVLAPLAESGAGSESLAVAASTSLADSGSAADSWTVDQGATPKDLADSAVGTDIAAVTATLTVFDVAAATEGLTRSPSSSGPYYGITATDLADGLGVWVNPTYALADDGLVATWTAP